MTSEAPSIQPCCTLHPQAVDHDPSPSSDLLHTRRNLGQNTATNNPKHGEFGRPSRWNSPEHHLCRKNRIPKWSTRPPSPRAPQLQLPRDRVSFSRVDLARPGPSTPENRFPCHHRTTNPHRVPADRDDLRLLTHAACSVGGRRRSTTHSQPRRRPRHRLIYQGTLENTVRGTSGCSDSEMRYPARRMKKITPTKPLWTTFLTCSRLGPAGGKRGEGEAWRPAAGSVREVQTPARCHGPSLVFWLCSRSPSRRR